MRPDRSDVPASAKDPRAWWGTFSVRCTAGVRCAADVATKRLKLTEDGFRNGVASVDGDRGSCQGHRVRRVPLGGVRVVSRLRLFRGGPRHDRVDPFALQPFPGFGEQVAIILELCQQLLIPGFIAE